MALSLTNFNFLALFSSLLLGLGVDAVDVTITPPKCIATIQKRVEISCMSDFVKEVTLIELYKQDEDPIAFLKECSNISVRNDMKSRVKGTGRLDGKQGLGFLNVTLMLPSSEDAGAYHCLIYYVDEAGHMQTEKGSGNLIVEKLDVTALEIVLNVIQDRITTLEKGDNLKNTKLDEGSLEYRIATLEKENKDMKEKDSNTVAFSVGTKNQRIPTVKGKVIKFPDIFMQIGECYDLESGIFTPQRDGLYVFHLVMYTFDEADMRLMVNDKYVSRIRAHDSSHSDQSSVSAVVSLSAGDKVFVQMENDGGSLGYNFYTYFTGYLVKAY